MKEIQELPTHNIYYTGTIYPIEAFYAAIEDYKMRERDKVFLQIQTLMKIIIKRHCNKKQ